MFKKREKKNDNKKINTLAHLESVVPDEKSPSKEVKAAKSEISKLDQLKEEQKNKEKEYKKLSSTLLDDNETGFTDLFQMQKDTKKGLAEYIKEKISEIDNDTCAQLCGMQWQESSVDQGIFINPASNTNNKNEIFKRMTNIANDRPLEPEYLKKRSDLDIKVLEQDEESKKLDEVYDYVVKQTNDTTNSGSDKMFWSQG